MPPPVSTGYVIESEYPFRFVTPNSKGRWLLPVLLPLLLMWGYFELALAYLLSRLITNVLNGHTVLIGITEETPKTFLRMNPVFWGLALVITASLLILGLVFGWFLMQEIIWRLVGKELVEIGRDRIVWSHRIPFSSYTKTYSVEKLQKLKVWRPDFVSHMDTIRPTFVFYRGLGAGAIELVYETQTIQIASLISSVDAEVLLKRLQKVEYWEPPPVEV